jgi:transcription elongation GreA/GreB family factor
MFPVFCNKMKGILRTELNKKDIFLAILKELQTTFDVIAKSAHEARDAATNEESKAENKYDTRGLEASYLAGAQAKRATEIQESIKKLTQLKVNDFDKATPIQITALVEVQVNDETRKWLFLLPYAGGVQIEFEGQSVQTLSPESPLGKKLIGSSVNDLIELKVGKSNNEYEILNVC